MNGVQHSKPLASAALMALALTPLACAATQPPRSSVPEAELAGHVGFLASDLLEGRGIGARGGAIGVAYIESVFRGAGLSPGYGASFRQAVPLRAYASDPDARLTFGERPSLTPGDDFVGVSFGLPGGAWSGEPLFVGYAIESAGEPWDDFKGADVRGRLLVAFTNEPGRGEPSRFRGRELTVHGRWRTKFELAAKLGAAAMLLVHTTGDAGYGWHVVRAGWTGEAFRLADDPLVLPFQGWVAEARARELFAAAGTSLEALRAQAERPDFRPVPLRVPVHLTAAEKHRDVRGTNVVAVAPGRGENAVLVTAHHDHLGRGEAVSGDDIYNGAVDNGSAVALLLALATHYGRLRLHTHPPVVFAAVDAEEEGLLGAAHYAKNPAWPLGKTTANVNLELANVWGRTRDIQAIGAEHSELADVLGDVLPTLGLRLTADRVPEQGYFFRSDQYALAQAGVPGIWLGGGTDYVGRPEGWGDAVYKEFREKRYHRPSDEVQPDWDLRGLAQLGDVVLGLVDALGKRPLVAWRTSDYARRSK